MATNGDKLKTPANEPTSFVRLTAVGGDGIPHDALTLGLKPVEKESTNKVADLSAVKSILSDACFFALTSDKLRAVGFDESVAHLQESLTHALKDALWIATVITFIKALPPNGGAKNEWLERHPELEEEYEWVRNEVRNWKVAHRGRRDKPPTSNVVIAGIVHDEEGAPEGSIFADLPNPELSHSPTEDDWRRVAGLIQSALDFVSTQLEQEKAAIERNIWDEMPVE